MQEATIQANPNISRQVLSIGREKNPVVLIDDFASDTSGVIDHARNSVDFVADGASAYPGVRAPLTRSYVIAAIDAIYPILSEVYSVPAQLRLKPQRTVYSLVCTAEDKLKVLQRLPHFDSNKPYYFAITHYLNSGEFGGTGFYRHKPTSFESVTETRLDEYIDAGNAFLEENGNPDRKYFGASDDHYELLERVDYRPNRLVAYPGYLLHSGLVKPGRDISSDPATGRLTANIFVDFR